MQICSEDVQICLRKTALRIIKTHKNQTKRQEQQWKIEVFYPNTFDIWYSSPNNKY